MSYIPAVVKLHTVTGILFSMEAMRKPKGSQSDSYRSMFDYLIDGEFCNNVILGPGDARLAGQLIRAGNDHAKAMRGIIAYIEIKMQTGFMIEFETYRIGVECLSTSSSMHNELKELKGSELAEKKQADLPEKVYDRSLTMSYQALRSIYRARKNHRHPDWRIFCSFIEGLPYFKELIYPEFKEPVRLLS